LGGRREGRAGREGAGDGFVAWVTEVDVLDRARKAERLRTDVAEHHVVRGPRAAAKLAERPERG